MSARTLVLVVVCAGVFMSSLDLFIVNIAFPDIQRDFDGSSFSDLSWILNAYAIVFAALLVPAGRLADLAGRKRAFLGGLAVFIAASAASAAAPSVEVLVAARIVQAAGAALMIPASLGLLLAEFPPERRAAAVGAWAAVGGVAAAAGPPLGGLLVEASWRWIFLANVPVGLAALAIGARVLHETRDTEDRRLPDLAGAALLVGGVALLALAIVKGEQWGWDSARVLGSLGGAAVLLAAVAVRSASHPVPVVEPAIVRVRSFAMAGVASFLFFAAFSAMLLENVLVLTRELDWSVLEAGLGLAPGPLTAAIFSAPAGRLGGRIGQRAVGVPGTILFALGCAWPAVAISESPSYALEFLPGLLIGGAGVGLVIPSLSAAAAGSLPPARFATGTAVFVMTRQIGAALGVAAIVAILGTPGLADFRTGWWFMVALSLAAGVAAAAIGRGPVQQQAAAPRPRLLVPQPGYETGHARSGAAM